MVTRIRLGRIALWGRRNRRGLPARGVHDGSGILKRQRVLAGIEALRQELIDLFSGQFLAAKLLGLQICPHFLNEVDLDSLLIRNHLVKDLLLKMLLGLLNSLIAGGTLRASRIAWAYDVYRQ